MGVACLRVPTLRHDGRAIYNSLTLSCIEGRIRLDHGVLEDHARAVDEILLKFPNADRQVADFFLKSQDFFTG